MKKLKNYIVFILTGVLCLFTACRKGDGLSENTSQREEVSVEGMYTVPQKGVWGLPYWKDVYYSSDTSSNMAIRNCLLVQFQSDETEFDINNVGMDFYFGDMAPWALSYYKNLEENKKFYMGVYFFNENKIGELYEAEGKEYPYTEDFLQKDYLHRFPIGTYQDIIHIERKLTAEEFYSDDYLCVRKDGVIYYAHKEKLTVPSALFSEDNGTIRFGVFGSYRAYDETGAFEIIYNWNDQMTLFHYEKMDNKIKISSVE